MSISAALLMLPPWQALILVLVVMAGLSLLAFFLASQLMPLRLRLIHNDVAGFIYAAIGAIYGVLLAFVVVVVWEQYDSTRVNTQQEATTALQLYYEMGILEDGRAQELRSGLLNYLRDVVDKEYPAMTRLTQINTNPASAAGLVSVWQAAKKLQPDTAQEQILYDGMLAGLAELSRLRAQRLDDAWEALPEVIWLGLLGGAIITMLFAILLGTENTRVHALMVTLQAVLIGLIFHMVIQMDHPFVGALSISDEPFTKVIDALGGDAPTVPTPAHP